MDINSGGLPTKCELEFKLKDLIQVLNCLWWFCVLCCCCCYLQAGESALWNHVCATVFWDYGNHHQHTAGWVYSRIHPVKKVYPPKKFNNILKKKWRIVTLKEKSYWLAVSRHCGSVVKEAGLLTRRLHVQSQVFLKNNYKCGLQSGITNTESKLWFVQMWLLSRVVLYSPGSHTE